MRQESTARALAGSTQANRRRNGSMSTEVEQPDFTAEATDYEIGQDNIRPFGLDIHNPVFVFSATVVIAFVVLVLLLPEGSADLLRLAATLADLDLRLAVHDGHQHLRAVLPVPGGLALGQDPAGRRRCQAGLLLFRLVRHAVRRRHGHRPHVLRRARAGLPLPEPALGHRSGEHRGGPGRGHGRHHLSTGACIPGRSTRSWR